MKCYKIHLIRHGATLGNSLGQYIGVTDSPLSDDGKNALIDMKEKNLYPDAQVHFVSPLKRCIETAKIIYPDAKPIIIKDFSECDFGDWEGKTGEELKDNTEFQKWVSGGENATPPNGESGVDFQIRTCTAFERVVEGLMKSCITSAAIVAHGGTIMSILAAYGLPRANFYDWMVPNGQGYSIIITPSLWMRSKVVEVYNTIPDQGDAQNDMVYYVYNVARQTAMEIIGENKEKEDNNDNAENTNE